MNVLFRGIAWMTVLGIGISLHDYGLGDPHPCRVDIGENCVVDGYVGTKVIFDDANVRIWNFTLAPGEMTSMHSHDSDYYFVAIKPTQLEVWGVGGERLFDFRAEGTLGFKVDGDFLKPVNVELPFAVPRVHAAKNIGPTAYHEILFETKTPSAIDVFAEL